MHSRLRYILQQTRKPGARFGAILGSDEKVATEWTKHRDDPPALRTVRLQSSGRPGVSGDFFMLLAPSRGGTRVEAVKFIRGDERLKSIQDSLLQAFVSIEVSARQADQNRVSRNTLMFNIWRM